MTLAYSPDPARWIKLPTDPAPGWAADLAPVGRLVAALEQAARGVGDGEERWVLVDEESDRVVVVDLDVVDLGEDVPVGIDIEEEAGQTEEFTAGLVRGKRTVWVSPASPRGGPVPAQNGSVQDSPDPLRAQALYVGTVPGTGYLVTMRTGLHPLDQVVAALGPCEQFLATIRP